MDFTAEIIKAYPELADKNFLFNGIMIQDDSDGKGAYIREWNYTKPIPEGLKVGK
jgi:hypothetical protein